MAAPNDLRESFPGLEDRVSGAGVALAATVEGQAAAAQQGLIGFAFKDKNGNVVLPILDLQGRVPVSTELQGTRLRAKGAVAGSLLVAGANPSLYTGMTVVTSVPLTNTATGLNIGDMKASVQCRRDALFQLCYQDSANVVILDEALTGPGQYNVALGIDNDTFTVPASAASPAFIVRAGCFQQLSDMHAACKVVQF